MYYKIGFLGECLKALGMYMNLANIVWVVYAAIFNWHHFNPYSIIWHIVCILIATAIYIGGMSCQYVDAYWAKQTGIFQPVNKPLKKRFKKEG